MKGFGCAHGSHTAYGRLWWWRMVAIVYEESEWSLASSPALYFLYIYHARVGNDAKRVQVRCAQWMMRTAFT